MMSVSERQQVHLPRGPGSRGPDYSSTSDPSRCGPQTS